jgi:tRNA(fMet)-specific endonuclease VapC
MPPKKALIDSDILLSIMQGNPSTLAKAHEYLAAHGRFTFSVITKYEILRGLRAIRASKQAEVFDEFCSKSEIISLDDSIAVRAADIYADLKAGGGMIGDADILIAASALVNGLGVVTNNQAHFRRIKGLRVENWLMQ